MRSWKLLCLTALLSGCVEYDYVKFEGVDVFYQHPASEVDILLVVDNSCSMSPYQRKLSENFSQFISFFIAADVDYHIGVVTTTVSEVEPTGGVCNQSAVDEIPAGGHLVNDQVITPETDDAESVFAQTVKVGTCGSGTEMGIESAYLALTDEDALTANAGFLREDASLSLIFVADEEDYSPLPVNTYINAFRDVKGQRERDVFNASALVITDMEVCDADQQEAGSKGTRYIDVARQTDGVRGNICDSDFESVVTELSLNSSRLEDTFLLSDLPAPASLEVTVDDAPWPCEDGTWTYELIDVDGEDQPAIIFDRASMPPPNSQLTIRYDYGSGAPEDFCPTAASGT